jgi:hypothetical protein
MWESISGKKWCSNIARRTYSEAGRIWSLLDHLDWNPNGHPMSSDWPQYIQWGLFIWVTKAAQHQVFLGLFIETINTNILGSNLIVFTVHLKSHLPLSKVSWVKIKDISYSYTCEGSINLSWRSILFGKTEIQMHDQKHLMLYWTSGIESTTIDVVWKMRLHRYLVSG